MVCRRTSPAANPSLCRAALAAHPGFAREIFPLALTSVCAKTRLGGTGQPLLINRGGLIMVSPGRQQRKGCKCSAGHAWPPPIITSPPFHSPCQSPLPWMRAAEYFILSSSQQPPCEAAGSATVGPGLRPGAESSSGCSRTLGLQLRVPGCCPSLWEVWKWAQVGFSRLFLAASALHPALPSVSDGVHEISSEHP